MPTPLRLCIVAFNAYPAVNPSSGGQVGGTETRAWLLARELAKQPGIQVSLAVRTTEPIRQETVDGVRIIGLRDRFYRVREAVGGFASRQPGFPWIKVHRWSPALLWQVPLLASARLFEARPGDPRQPMPFFEQIDADLFCCFGNQATAATAIASAHSTGRPAALFLGSDDDLNPAYTVESEVRNPYGDTGATCYFSLTQSDAVFVQTPEQEQLLHERFHRDGILIPNPIDLREWDARSEARLPAELHGGLDEYVLWMGRAENIHKRPQTMVEIARQCPDVPILMLLNPRDPAVDAEVRRTAPANVRIVTQVPFPLMPAVFRKALAFINTSSLEGFPNAFLQAAASRVPVVSLNVGRAFLESSQAGSFVGENATAAARELQRLMNSPDPRSQMGDAGRRYVEQHHTIEAVTAKFAEALRAVRLREA
ncbi:MAG: glycosyltransferase family 4 protein [Planctomycetaceae bacterium]